MNFLNLGLGEVIFIILVAVIIFGPKNMVKTARDVGAFLRKVTQSPYWQEVWATRREISEIPKMIAKEAQLKETMRELNLDTRNISSPLSASMNDFLREVNQETKPENPRDQEKASDPLTTKSD